jgi:hypothetical protein
MPPCAIDVSPFTGNHPLRKQKRCNLVAISSVVLATILALLAIARIDVTQVFSRDAQRLSASARSLNIDPRQFPPSGFVWLCWDEPLQRYLEASGATIDQRFALVNTLITDAPPQLQPVDQKPQELADGSCY